MQRRRERRYEVWESVVLTVRDRTGDKHVPAILLDICRSGYRILTSISLVKGTGVLITFNSVAISGFVRHCGPAGNDSFSAGVEITNVDAGVMALTSTGPVDLSRELSIGSSC